MWQCFVPPEVGSADNADFAKVIGWFDLGSPLFDSHVAQFVDIHYVRDAKYHYPSGFYSSEVLLTAAAVAVNSLVSKAGRFDLRIMGAVHAIVFLITLWLLLPLAEAMPRIRRCALLGLIAAAFTDVMYVAYFNSFFMDTGSLLFLLLAVVAYLRAAQWQRPMDYWMFTAAAVLLVTSKTQHFPLMFPIAMLLAWRSRFLMAAIVLAAGAFSSQASPPQYSVYGKYTTVFYQVLPKTKNVEAALADLGLQDSDRQYVGTHAYSANAGVRDPEFTTQFGRRLTYATLARYLVTHPRDALRLIEDRLSEAGRQRPLRGNFPASAGFVGFTESHTFAVWSGWKARLFENNGRVYLAYATLLGLSVAVGAMLLRRRLPGGVAEGVVALAAMLFIELLVAGLGDGLDAARHFLIFAALTDILLLSAIYLAFEKARV